MRISDWSSDVCSSDLAIKKAAHSAASRIRAPLLTFFAALSSFFVMPNTSSSPRSGLETLRSPQQSRSNTTKARGHPGALPKTRSEEHTSALQSLMRNSYAILCLKKQKIYTYKQKIKNYNKKIICNLHINKIKY